MDDKVLRDWDHADQYLNDNLNNVDGNLNGIVSEVEHIKGTADGQFIYDTEAKMTKVVPDGVSKGIVKEIGGKTVKTRNLIRYPWLFSGTVENDDVKMVIYDNGTLDITAKRTTVSDFRYAIISQSNGRIRLKPNTTYIASIFNELANEDTAFVFMELLPAESTGTRTRAINLLNTSVEFTTTSEELYANVVIKVNKGNSAFNTLKLSPVIYEKTEAVDYFEPYFEGLHNAPVEKVVAYTNGNHLNYGKGYNNSANPYGFMDNALRCTSDELLAPISGFLNVSVSHPTKTMQFTIVELTDDRKVVKDSSWQPSNIVNNYALQSNTKYLRIVVRYSDNSTIVLDDAIDFKVNTGVNETIISLSDIIKDLPDYGCSSGDVYNYIDFENSVYHHRVRKIDATKLNWQLESEKGYYSNDFKNQNIIKLPANMLSDKYPYSTTLWKSMCFGVNSNGTIWTGDTSVVPSTIDRFEIVFELATEELIDISDLITPFDVEPNGIVTFENEHNLDIPNTVIYEKEMI